MKIRLKKVKTSIVKIILITFVSIIIISNLVIGSIIFTNWFKYADRALTEISIKLEDDVVNIVEFYIENHWTGIKDKDQKGLINHLKLVIKDRNSKILIVDRNTGEVFLDYIKIEDFLNTPKSITEPILIYDMGYPALSEAYNTYLDSNVESFKLKNNGDKLYINISEFNKSEINWVIITALSDKQLTSTIIKNIIYTIVIVIISLIISIVIYFYLIKKLIQPLFDLLDITDKFTKGDLSMRLLVSRNDEIGLITNAFNNMADTIYRLVNTLEDKVKQRTFDLEKTNDILKDNRDHLRLILDSTAEGIYGMDIDGNCTFCNKSVLKILGYKHYTELIGKQMHYTIHYSRNDGTKISLDECRIIKAIKEGSQIHVDDEVFWRKDGTYVDVEYRVYPQKKDGRVVGAVVSFTDITESKKAKEQINYLRFYDPVTGLHNRQFFESEISKIDNVKNLPLSVIYGDVNGLKLINDIFGHEKGDELLRKTGDVLTRVTRDEDIIARIGGDEFIIILKNIDKKETEKIIKRIKREMLTEDISGVRGSISLGTDTKFSSDIDIREVIRNAEEEMYRVKTLESKEINSKMLDNIMEALFEKSPREKIHAQNVSKISGNIAKNMGLTETDIRIVKDIGYYHDIDKIILSKKILYNIDNLSSEEQREMETHTLIGYRVLNLFNQTVDMAEVVLSHHERWDGKGYPKKLKGREIPLY